MVSVSATSPEPFNHRASTIDYCAVSPQKIDKINQILKQGWNISNVEAILEVSRHTAYSHNYWVTTQNQDLMLRESIINTSPAQKVIDDCFRYAKQQGLPVPVQISSIIGNYYYSDSESNEKETIYSLTTKIDGVHFTGSQIELENAAILLARFHQVFNRYPNAHHLSLIQGEVYIADQEKWANIQNKAKCGNDQFDKWVLELISFVNEREKIFWYDFSHLPAQIGHFDWNPHNLLFSKEAGTVVGLLDFDLMRIAQRAKDVGLGMHKFARVFGEKTECQQDIGATIRFRSHQFLLAYHDTNPLTDIEIAYMPSLLFDEIKRKLLYILGKHYLLNDDSSNFDLEKQWVQIAELDMLTDLHL